ncbi:MAG TPA: protein-disulfide reductase DsbD [Burkholderiales bacterium]
MLRILLLLLGVWSAFAHAEPELLEPDKAFSLSVRAVSPSAVEVRYKIADGYYMYRDKFAFEAVPATLALGTPVFPQGEVKQDEFFGTVEVYRGDIAIRVPITGQADRAQLRVTSQGCADIGVCYPPQKQVKAFNAAALSGIGPGISSNSNATTTTDMSVAGDNPLLGAREVRNVPAIVSDESRFATALDSGSLPLIVGMFFVAGVLLTFTPCVLPMVPILSGLIMGEGRQVNRTNATILSVAYVLGMALTYTAIGVAAALSGSFLSAALQNPWVLSAFALVFIVLALSMFDFYDIQLPGFMQTHAIVVSGKLQGGRIGAVAVMGMLSAAIVSPCVAAPLAGALLYISQTRDALLGGSALFAMALGMGVPLIAVGVTGGALLPKSGHWMKAVKKFFGFLLLGVAVWIVSPLLPVAVQMIAWATLLIVGAMFLHAMDPLPQQANGTARFWKGVGVIALLVGASLLLGALSGGQSLLRPLDALRGDVANAQPRGVTFERVRDVAELEARLASATQPVLLDFYADWCVSCKEMEAFTFTDPQVRSQMARMTLLQVDVTRNNAADQALLKRFNLFGPPAIIFFDATGREVNGVRVIGYQPAKRFQQTLNGVLSG